MYLNRLSDEQKTLLCESLQRVLAAEKSALDDDFLVTSDRTTQETITGEIVLQETVDGDAQRSVDAPAHSVDAPAQESLADPSMSLPRVVQHALDRNERLSIEDSEILARIIDFAAVYLPDGSTTPWQPDLLALASQLRQLHFKCHKQPVYRT